MSDRQIVVLDDLDAAYDRLSEFGKPIVLAVMRIVREAVGFHAALHGWHFLKHSSFVSWAETQASKECSWLILDPLFPSERIGSNAKTIRFTRSYEDERWQIMSKLPREIEESLAGKEVGIVDDACARGLTLRHAHDLVHAAGGDVSRIIVCVSTDVGRSAVEEMLPSAGVLTYLSGDVSALHLRDGCPGLPFSGRRMAERSEIKVESGSLSVCVPPTAFRGGLWEKLSLDSNVRWALISARRLLATRMSAALGRPAVVADISLLGPDVSIPLFPQQAAEGNTPLSILLT